MTGVHSKFKRGDKVTITQMSVTAVYPSCTPSMVAVARYGYEHVVEKVRDDGLIVLKNFTFNWHPDWLEHAYEFDSL